MQKPALKREKRGCLRLWHPLFWPTQLYSEDGPLQPIDEHAGDVSDEDEP